MAFRPLSKGQRAKHVRTSVGEEGWVWGKNVQVRKELTEYASALNEVRRPLFRSLHQVLGRVAQLQSLPQAPHPAKGDRLDSETLQAIVAAAESLSRAWAPVERAETFFWRDLAFTNFGVVQRREISEDLRAAEVALERLQSVAAEVLSETGLSSWPLDVASAERLVTLLDHLKARDLTPSAWLFAPSLEPIAVRARKYQRDAPSPSRLGGCAAAPPREERVLSL